MKIRAMVRTLVAVIFIPALSMAGDVVFIGNPSVSTSALNKYDVKGIFLGSKVKWEDGKDIVIIVQNKSDCHKIFLEKYISKTPSQFSSYWKKRIFTGKAVAPPSVDSDQEIINFVSKTEGAIGYVCSDKGLNKVKIISAK